jgi:choline dehydrogenase-like flavoprotein
MAEIEADVIIVGSGISGALLAAKLSAAGVKVAILEAGARVDRAEARQRFWNAPIRVPECPYPPTPEANHPVSNDPDHWYRQVGPNKFKSTYLKVVGGTTWHWLGTCLRFVPNDFRLRTAHGRGIDWPISYDELEPFYREAEHEIGVAGDSGEPLGSPRSAGYPMPAIPQTFLDKAYARALTGTEYELRATPQARNSVSGNGRPACCGNASCIPICPIGAKYDATVHLSLAERNGALVHPQPRPRESKSAPRAVSPPSASSVGTAAKAWLPAKSSCLRHTRSRPRGCCCTFAARRCRTGWPIAPARSAAISWTIRHS